MGTLILMPSFLIVLMGGLGSIPGTIIGGLLVGISTSLATLVIPRFVDIIPYILMGVIIYFRPRGLFGEQSILE
jgi:branched-chain amino acid transport system permease protein